MNFFDGVPFAKNPQTGAGEPVPGATANYLEVDEAVEALRGFRQAGLQLVNVTAGCPGLQPPRRPSRGSRAAGWLRVARAAARRRRPPFLARGGGAARLSRSARRRHRLQLSAPLRRGGRRGEYSRRARVDRRAGARRHRLPRLCQRRDDGQEEGVHHRQLLHDADARQGQRARSICGRVCAAGSHLRQAPPGDSEESENQLPAVRSIERPRHPHVRRMRAGHTRAVP